MFNLDQRILEWRRQMLAAGIKTPVPLDELENHLCEEIEQQMAFGLNEEAAFDCAAQKIGQAHALENEFKKVGEANPLSDRDSSARWHYPLLVLAWNTTAGLYFLPGKPSFCLIMILVSLFASVLACIMNRSGKFISVPSVTWPLLFISAVVLATAMLTGGTGGGRYVVLLVAVLGYFALAAQRIPIGKADLYVKLFFLGALSAAVASLALVIGPAFYSVFYILPADAFTTGSVADLPRFGGLALASAAVIALLLARYGLRGIFNSGKYWRLLAFCFFAVLSLLGGYRFLVFDLALLCFLMFCLEGLFRARVVGAVVVAAVLAALLVVPFANKLPRSMQRSLSFLPFHLDKGVVSNARETTHWRMNTWKEVWPQVPRHLVLGKGLGPDAGWVWQILRDEASRGSDIAAIALAAGEAHNLPGKFPQIFQNESNQANDSGALAIAMGDCRNGPLSVLLPFGLAGLIGFVWFLVASGRVLYRNYKLGDPALLQTNRCLYALFITKAVMFFFVVGSFYTDMVYFVGFVGLSIALNGGACSPGEDSATSRPVLVNKLKLASG